LWFTHSGFVLQITDSRECSLSSISRNHSPVSGSSARAAPTRGDLLMTLCLEVSLVVEAIGQQPVLSEESFFPLSASWMHHVRQRKPRRSDSNRRLHDRLFPYHEPVNADVSAACGSQEPSRCDFTVLLHQPSTVGFSHLPARPQLNLDVQGFDREPATSKPCPL
jgi:hypothetical protein